MFIKVKQRGRKRYHSDIERAAHFFCDTLFDDDIQENLSLTIQLKKCNGHHGYMLQGLNNRKFNRYYEITLNRDLDLCSLISALAHEMVHIQQVEKGYFLIKTYRGSDILSVLWHDKLIKNVPSIKYAALPWEIEANEREIELLNLYLKDLESE